MNKNVDFGSNEEFVELLSSMQSDRMDSQRAELAPPAKKKAGAAGGGGARAAASLPGTRADTIKSTLPERDFIELLARVQGSRIDDQRAELPRRENKVEAAAAARPAVHAGAGRPEPDEHFITALMNLQDTRFNDQRCVIPKREEKTGKANSKGSCGAEA